MRAKVLFVALAFASACFAKDIKTVVLTTNPQMHCNNCENKIKNNIRHLLKSIWPLPTAADSGDSPSS